MSTNPSEKSFSSTFRVDYSTLKFKEMLFSLPPAPEKLLPLYQTTQCHFSEDCNLVNAFEAAVS